MVKIKDLDEMCLEQYYRLKINIIYYYKEKGKMYLCPGSEVINQEQFYEIEKIVKKYGYELEVRINNPKRNEFEAYYINKVERNSAKAA